MSQEIHTHPASSEHADQSVDESVPVVAPETAQASDLSAANRLTNTIEFSSPGLTPLRRYGTAIMLFILGLFVIGIIFYEGHSGIVAAVLGALLIAGFVWYLRMIAPAPFTLQLTPEGLVRKEQEASEPLVIPWDQFARVKEEQFPNGKIIAVMIYARSKRSVYRALVLYRDDLPHFDDFRKALKDATLPETPWVLETVHE
jgi:hypothetical protein